MSRPITRPCSCSPTTRTTRSRWRAARRFTSSPTALTPPTRRRARWPGDRDVSIAGGASTVRQALAAGVIDELILDIAPVVLGAGESPFHGVADLRLEPIEVIHSPLATHVRYRVGALTAAADRRHASCSASAPARAHAQSGGVNWLAVNTAPCGSRISAVRVHWLSSVDRTSAPSRCASAAAASRSATEKVTCQCGGQTGLERGHPGDRILEARRRRDPRLALADGRVDGGLEVVAVARAADHRREAEVLHRPAEHVGVEGDRVRLVGVQVAEVPRSRLVDDLGSGVLAGLPQAEGDARRDPAGSRTGPNGPTSPGSSVISPPAAESRAAAAPASSTAM